MPKLDRGFIKWQPFNALISSKEVLNEINDHKTITKPTLFPEAQELLNELILEAYYAQNTIYITFYEQNKIKKIKALITKINTYNNTLEINHSKIISFNQIINIT